MEVIFEGKVYIVCGESTGVGEDLVREGVINPGGLQEPHCLNQWQCLKSRYCLMSVLGRGREEVHHVDDQFPETRRTG